MKRLLGALLGAGLLLSGVLPAHAAFLDGFLAECTAVTATTCTELSGGTYARQPISFSDPNLKGMTVNRTPYSFGSAAGVVAGRAVYDSASGGNLLVVIPLAAPVTTPPPDQSDVGAISFTVAGMVGLGNPATYNALVAAGGTIGTSFDGSTVTAVQQAAITKGIFAARAAAADAAYTRLVPVTGFTTTVGNGVSTLILDPAGTIAAGTVTTAPNPGDGQTLKIACGATITALTVTANTGQTLAGSPTTCTPTQGHQFRYALGATKWYMDY